MKVYLAGPMQGIPHFNFPLFNEIADRLRAAGHEVFNPAQRDIERHNGVDIGADNPTGSLTQSVAEHNFSLDDALADDTHYICKHADAICLLPGWEYSNGALAEWFLARALGKSRPFAFLYLLKHGDQYVVSSVSKPEAIE